MISINKKYNKVWSLYGYSHIKGDNLYTYIGTMFNAYIFISL